MWGDGQNFQHLAAANPPVRPLVRTGIVFLSVIHPEEGTCNSRDCDSARSMPIGRAVRCYHCADGGAVAAGKEEPRQTPGP